MASKPVKRQLSPAPLPPPKRQHGLYSPSPRGIAMSFDDALYDELVLFIFSFLNSRDLCAIQAANKNCSRLACDNQVLAYILPWRETVVEHERHNSFLRRRQLWKTLFVRDFGKARLRGGKGFYSRTDDRLVKRLPSRASPPADDSQSLNWKWMYRISSNWRNGRCAVESLGGGAPSTSSPTQTPPSATPRFHVLLADALTISASSEMSHQPIILLRSRSNTVRSLKCRSSTTTGPVGISTIAIDQSRPSKTSKHDGLLRFVAFLSTGEFSIYEYDPLSISPSPKLAYIPLPRHRSHVMHAAYHHPLLVTLSHTFTLMIYDLSEDTITHTHSLSSFTSHPPTSLILSAMPSSTSYKLVLAYAIPVYPAHWSVGVTELIISSSGSVTPTAALSGTTGPASLSTANFTVAGTRSARAFDVPQGWIDDEKLKAMRTQWGRKVKQVADTQTDGKWVVLAPGDASESPPSLDEGSSSDGASTSSTSSYVSPPSHTSTQLQLYRLYMPPFSSSHPPRLSFVRTLHGPLGPVSALSLADGRCVSLGINGSIWVWDLEGGEEAEIAGPVGSKQASRRGTVMFDERRIVTSGVRGMEERRFDI